MPDARSATISNRRQATTRQCASVGVFVAGARRFADLRLIKTRGNDFIPSGIALDSDIKKGRPVTSFRDTRFWRRLFPFLAAIAAIGSAQTASAQAAAVSEADLDGLVRTEMHDKGVQGLSIAVIRDGKVDWVRGYGVTDHETKAPVTEKTTFQVASLGKMSAAYAIMMLAEEGTLSLDHPVSHERLTILEGCTAPTVRQALSHMTGLENDFFAQVYTADCMPGSRFRYSGQGYATIAELIAAQKNMAVADAIDEMLFSPLAMELTQYGERLGTSQANGHVSALALFIGRAVFGSPLWVTLSGLFGVLIFLFLPAIIAGRAKGFGAAALALFSTHAILALVFFAGTRMPAKMHVNIDAGFIAASLTSNAEDLATFGAELMRPTLISMETRDLMLTQQTDQPGCIQWALGIGIDNCADTTTYWHWGSNMGFESLFVIDPQSGDGVVIITNTGGGLDTVIPGRGGHAAAKVIARNVLGIDGVWDISGK